MSQTEQRTIFGESLDEQIHIETTGRVIRPFKRMLDQVVGEYRLQFDSDGIHASMGDAANVQMINLELYADALDGYQVEDDTELGITSDAFGSALQHARYGKSSDDPVTITADYNHLETETTRTLGGTDATINEWVALLDPASIREPIENFDLEYNTVVDLDPQALVQALKLVDKKTPVKFGTNPGNVVIQQKSDLNKRNIELDADPSEVSEWAMFSGDYMKQLKDTIQNGYVDSLTLRWSEEFPIVAEFEREGVYSGSVLTSPRIQAD